ncbi:diketogulonate reductase-like aldo/keto reductase [Roseiarcus fermentans]|uniref:Diketogulonate reductase-like aldo/keto reductase n=1 Tax=Roseiarcus fermentans TaxID=1473586 RepID=A0A366FSX0_9HYPH|nr:aldo/keto reductase [Roseiarcus fermentans]RBP17667.1 diketogulonate reductase-like aldo/keto reductase [Roseiarcus fermentans]
MSVVTETGQSPIDPASIPQRRLYTGATMPAIGLGTFGSDSVSAADVAAAVRGAVEIGYRHVDCASVYGNEAAVGASLEAIMRGGVAREELWITSKVWNDRHAPDAVIASCRASLADLRLDYLDLYLVHWPFPNFHPPGCDVSARSPDAKPYIHAEYMKTWRAMEALVDQGLVRHIGASNMTVPKLALLLRDARIKPAANEMELHPHFQQPALFDFVVANGIAPIGYCPLGSPGRPERDRTPEDTSPLEDPVILAIAEAHGVHPAAVCVKWAVQRGQTPIPFSVNPRNYAANLRAAAEDPLSDDEMRAIAGVDRNCRLIKGQVFLWKDGQSWEDLWDPDGTITPP